LIYSPVKERIEEYLDENFYGTSKNMSLDTGLNKRTVLKALHSMDYNFLKMKEIPFINEDNNLKRLYHC
jgi:hypothetical protein